MQILDQDMQMVRDFLSQQEAPFHIQSHFENLVSEHAKEAGRADDVCKLNDELLEKVDDLKDVADERDRLQEEIDDRDRDELRALETVKYWLLDVLVHGRPMQKPPREVLRIVEDVL